MSVEKAVDLWITDYKLAENKKVPELRLELPGRGLQHYYIKVSEKYNKIKNDLNCHTDVASVANSDLQ